jgi:hemolysin activation/secretion protein
LVKKIVVQGVTLLSKDEIKKIALPFQNHWLSKNDIEEIITRIKKAYKEKGYNNQPADTSFRVKGNLLEIRITEGK